jgi:tryptophan synthase beta chain
LRKAEGIIPAPEANHGIATVRSSEALIAQARRVVSKTILFNLCGHGQLRSWPPTRPTSPGSLQKHEMTQGEIDAAVALIDTPAIPA